MSKIRYNYKTKITFSEKIYSHSYLLRLIPYENEAQHIIESNYKISPMGVVNSDTDAFGNQFLAGYVGEFHHSFEFSSEGIVETFPYILHEKLNPIYLFPSGLTKPLDNILLLNSELKFSAESSIHQKAAFISELMFKTITYEQGVTGINTTAEEALTLKKGVCQDYAHIMVSLCRLNKIPARYVAGFIEGEGFSHAWMEYYTDGEWHGFDPTHNTKIAINYIKIAQGRDYGDCPIDNGIFRGIAFQNIDVNVKVEHEDKE